MLLTLSVALLTVAPKLALADSDNSLTVNNDISTSYENDSYSNYDRDRNPRQSYRWVRLGDFGPNMCNGTPQAGDSNPHIVWSPDEVGVRCGRWNVGQRYCDAGYDGRYLDRYWECQRTRW